MIKYSYGVVSDKVSIIKDLVIYFCYVDNLPYVNLTFSV